MTLGEKLKDARKQASLSQEQLAEKLGVSALRWQSGRLIMGCPMWGT